MSPLAIPAQGMKLIFDGQSFNFAPAVDTAFPIVLTASLPASKYRSDVVGVSSTTYAQRSVDAATRVDQRIPLQKTILFDVGGPSDIIANLTATQVLTAAEAYADARRTAGVDIIIGFTVTPGSSAWYSSGQDTVRQTYNTNLKASSHFNAVVDMASLPHAANPNDTTYFYDGLHPTSLLVADIVALILTTMTSLGLPLT